MDEVTGWGLVLAAARVGPLVLLAPALAGLPLPRLAQAVVALVVATLVASAMGEAGVALAALAPAARLLVLGRELLIGVGLGVIAALPVVAATTAGGWVAAMAGDEDGASAWTTGFGLLAAVAFFGVGGHLAAVGAIGLSYRALPVGLGAHGAIAGTVVEAGAAMLAAAMMLAAPVLVTGMVVTLAAAAVERAAAWTEQAVPEAAARRLAILLAMAAAAIAVAVAVADDVRALPAALGGAIARLGGT